jgi:Flp pilus assembly protein TadG
MQNAMRKSGFLQAEAGASLVELALVLPVLFLILMGAVDFGRAYYLAMEVAGAAQAGAAFGSQNPTDTTGMTNAATADAPDVAGLTVATPTYGCECADGSGYHSNCSSTPSCPSNNVVYPVTVKVSATYTPWFPWPRIPSSILLSNSATMRAGSNL